MVGGLRDGHDDGGAFVDWMNRRQLVALGIGSALLRFLPAWGRMDVVSWEEAVGLWWRSISVSVDEHARKRFLAALEYDSRDFVR